MERVVGALVVAALLAVGCSGDDDADGAATSTPGADPTTTTTISPLADAPAAAAAADLCAGASAVTPEPSVAHGELIEASGLAASQAHDGILWAHNDSGGLPEVFAIGPDGADQGQYAVEGAAALDWEDMALAGDTLYLGDIGDNYTFRPAVKIYRAAEPEPTGSGRITDVDQLDAAYADGPRDAETLLADPVTGDLFVVSKSDTPAGLYRIPASALPGAEVTMERVADLPLPEGEVATSGEISADGSLIALRTYHDVLLWSRAPGQTVAEAMAGPACEAPAPEEVQGEAIAVDADGQGYTTISEGSHPAINDFRLS